VRCGAVRCGAVRCGAVRCGAVPYGMAGRGSLNGISLMSVASAEDYISLQFVAENRWGDGADKQLGHKTNTNLLDLLEGLIHVCSTFLCYRDILDECFLFGVLSFGRKNHVFPITRRFGRRPLLCLGLCLVSQKDETTGNWCRRADYSHILITTPLALCADFQSLKSKLLHNPTFQA